MSIPAALAVPFDFCNLNQSRGISYGVTNIGPGSKQPGPTERTENLRSSLVFQGVFRAPVSFCGTTPATSETRHAAGLSKLAKGVA